MSCKDRSLLLFSGILSANPPGRLPETPLLEWPGRKRSGRGTPLGWGCFPAPEKEAGELGKWFLKKMIKFYLN
jgi:hypothetical protein